MVNRPKLEDLFEIEYDETDPYWFIIKAKPEFAKHTVRLVSMKARLDFHQGRNEEDISISSETPHDHDITKSFNTLTLTRYDKSPEQGYFGRTELYIEGREVKNERGQ